MSNGWSNPAASSVVNARAGGRRAYNALRRDQKLIRRHEVEALLHRWGWSFGTQARIARELGVSDATVSRDVAAILPLYKPCGHCGTLLSKERAARVEDWRGRPGGGLSYDA